MNDRIKNYLGWAIIIAVLAVAYAAVSYVRTYSQSIEPGSFRSFAVSGEGKEVVKPDIAEFTFSVITKGGLDLAAVRGENDEKSKKASDFLKSLGIESKDIKTESFNLQPEYENYNCAPVYPFGAEPRPCPPPKIVGYSVSNTVSVKIREPKFEKIGEALSGVVTAGANSVSGLNFTVDDRAAAESRARTAAITQAQMKARAVARAGDFKLGRLLAIDEGGYGPIYQKYGRGGDAVAYSALEAAPAVPAIEPGSQDIIITVTLRYEIN